MRPFQEFILHKEEKYDHKYAIHISYLLIILVITIYSDSNSDQ